MRESIRSLLDDRQPDEPDTAHCISIAPLGSAPSRGPQRWRERPLARTRGYRETRLTARSGRPYDADSASFWIALPGGDWSDSLCIDRYFLFPTDPRSRNHRFWRRAYLDCCSDHRAKSPSGYLLVWGFRLSSVIQCSGPFNIKRAEGEPALVRGNVALRPCIRLDPGWIHTMKQSFASAARLRGGRDPFSIHGIKAKQIRGFCHLGS